MREPQAWNWCGLRRSDRITQWPFPEVVLNALLERISVDPEICGGKPCIKGTRIWVALILDFLADGVTEAELQAALPLHEIAKLDDGAIYSIDDDAH